MRTRVYYKHLAGEYCELSEDEIAERRSRQDSAYVLPEIFPNCYRVDPEDRLGDELADDFHLPGRRHIVADSS